jgi:hypothetical protein
MGDGGEVKNVSQMMKNKKNSVLIFVSRLDILLEMKLSGVAEQGSIGNLG